MWESFANGTERYTDEDHNIVTIPSDESVVTKQEFLGVNESGGYEYDTYNYYENGDKEGILNSGD